MKKRPYTVTIKTTAGTIIRLNNPPMPLAEIFVVAGRFEMDSLRMSSAAHQFGNFGAQAAAPPAQQAEIPAQEPVSVAEPPVDPRRSRFTSPF